MARTKFKDIKKAFKAAFPHTIPILAGFFFVPRLCVRSFNERFGV